MSDQISNANNTATNPAIPAGLTSDQPMPPYKVGKIFAFTWPRALLYIFAATVLSWTQGFGMNFVQSNLLQLQGYFNATPTETAWLMGAYMAPNVSLAILLIKIRTQYGLRNFAELSIIGMVVISLLHLFVSDLHTAFIVRFFGGVAAAPMSSIAFLYMIEAFAPAKKQTIGLTLNLMNVTLNMPLARIFSSFLFDNDGLRGLYMFEMSLALIGVGLIFYLPLTPVPRAKVLEKLDFVSYGFFAVGLAINALIMPVGRLYWWREAQWIGGGLFAALIFIVIGVVIELNRKNPLIDLRWLFSRDMLHIAAVLLIFRMLLSEQSTMAANFFNLFGLYNRELIPLYLHVIGGTIAGALICVFFLKPGREDILHAIALVLMAYGSWLDSYATNLTRPEQMYWSQALIGVGGGLFLPPSMFKGLASALARGQKYILSFIALFLFTQSTGGLMSSAFFGSLQTMLQKYHFSMITQHIVMSDPVVAGRVQQLSAAYTSVLTDSSLRSAEGIAILAKQATLEANILAYNDVFRIYSCIALTLLAFLLFKIVYGDFFRPFMALRKQKNTIISSDFKALANK